MNAIIVRVYVDKYGNYRGHVTGKRAFALGSDKSDATQWASDQLDKLPEARLSLLSDISMSDIEARRKIIVDGTVNKG